MAVHYLMIKHWTAAVIHDFRQISWKFILDVKNYPVCLRRDITTRTEYELGR